MKKFIILLFLSFLHIAFANDFTPNAKFLPVNEAFQFHLLEVDENKITIVLQAKQDYYLYRSSIEIFANQQKIPFDLDKGVLKSDPYFGETFVLFNDNLATMQNLDYQNLTISYQGCAVKGLCYPPDTTNITIQDTTNKINFISLYLLLLAGMSLSFTPCSLPMLPLLSSFLLKNSQNLKTSIALSLTYMLFMTISYSIIGLLMVFLSEKFALQEQLQSPIFIIPIALLFLAFALSMFDKLQINISGKLQHITNNFLNRFNAGSYQYASFYGLLSGILLSPCTTAPFAGILLFISTSANYGQGFLSLICLSIGMALPILLISIFGTNFLPKNYKFTQAIKYLFAFLMVFVAYFLFIRITNEKYIWLLRFCLLIFSIYAFDYKIFFKKTTIVGLIITFLSISYQFTNFKEENINTIRTVEEFQNLINNNKQTIMIDYYANWCISCKIFEKEVLETKQVQTQMQNIPIIRFDITKTNKEIRDFMKQMQIIGPPTLQFFNGNQEITTKRIVGEISQEAFLQHLQTMINKEQNNE